MYYFEINIRLEHTNMLSYLKKMPNSENAFRNNFILAGVDKNIIEDKIYVHNVINELKKKISKESVILVICPDTIESKQGTISGLNVVGDELKKQNFNTITQLDPYKTFWGL